MIIPVAKAFQDGGGVIQVKAQDVAELSLMTYQNMRRGIDPYAYRTFSGEIDTVRTTNFSANPFLFQARATSCTWSPTRGFVSGINEFELCKVEVMGQECPLEFAGGLDQFIGEDGSMMSTPEGALIVGKMIASLRNAVTRAAILTVVAAGAVPNLENYLVAEGVPAELGADAIRMDGLCNGWMKIAQDSGDSWMNNTTYINTMTITNGVVDPDEAIELLQSLMGTAQPALQDAMTTGVEVEGQVLRPVFIVSGNVYRALMTYYNQNQGSLAAGSGILRGGAVDTTTGYMPLYYGNIEIAVEPAMTGFSSYFADCFVTAAFLTVQRNIVLGASFQRIDNMGNGLVAQISPLITDMGKMTYRARPKVGAAISVNQLFTGAQRITS